MRCSSGSPRLLFQHYLVRLRRRPTVSAVCGWGRFLQAETQAVTAPTIEGHQSLAVQG